MYYLRGKFFFFSCVYFCLFYGFCLVYLGCFLVPIFVFREAKGKTDKKEQDTLWLSVNITFLVTCPSHLSSTDKG